MKLSKQILNRRLILKHFEQCVTDKHTKHFAILPYILANAICVKIRIMELINDIVDATAIQSSVYGDYTRFYG